MRKLIFKSLTTWTCLLFLILIALQWFPITGIFLMMIAAPYWVGYMPHLIAAALVIDILIKKFPKALLILPILPYCIYFYYYSVEQTAINGIENSIREANPSKILAYDPDTHALLTSGLSLGVTHKVPVTFSANSNFPEGYMSQRIATQALCKKARNNKYWRRAWPVRWSKYGKGGYHKRFKNLCRFEMPEVPNKQILKVVKKQDNTKDEKLRKTVYEFFLDNKILGEYTSATYDALPKFPSFIIGCFLNSSAPSWDCFYNIARKKRILNVFPSDNAFDAQNDLIIAVLLEVERYTEEELRNFRDYPETKEILSTIIEREKNKTPADFDEWGLRKDSLYQPKISETNGYPSFEGFVYHGNKGGPFKSFIKEHEGQIVYIDIDAKPNAKKDGFTNYGVCKTDERCNGRTDNSYRFLNKNGTKYNADEEGKFKGFFLVGKEIQVNHSGNKGDNDTRTILKAFFPNELNDIKTNNNLP